MQSIFVVIINLLFTLLRVEEVYADKANDLELLARKFSPILVLTQETGGEWGDIRVTKPEPVEIVGADSSSNIWLEVHRLSNHVASAPLDSMIFDTTDIILNQNRWYPNEEVDFGENRFAFLNHIAPKTYHALRGLLDAGIYLTRAFFEYPGETPTEWNNTYFGEGNKANDPQMGENFVNTAYVHIYKTTHEAYTDSITVIQYFYFYPYNHWWNNHEGDWEQVRVVVNSGDPDTAEVMGVEYSFHGAHLSYYDDYVMTYEVPPGVGNTDGSTTFTEEMPDLTSNFVFNPRRNVKLSQGTHPVVYVGAGSHGSFPIGGRILTYDRSIVTTTNR